MVVVGCRLKFCPADDPRPADHRTQPATPAASAEGEAEQKLCPHNVYCEYYNLYHNQFIPFQVQQIVQQKLQLQQQIKQFQQQVLHFFFKGTCSFV